MQIHIGCVEQNHPFFGGGMDDFLFKFPFFSKWGGGKPDLKYFPPIWGGTPEFNFSSGKW